MKLRRWPLCAPMVGMGPASVNVGAPSTSQTQGPFAPGPGFFGDGSDGAATADGVTAVAGMTLAGGNYKLSRDVFFATLTVNAGVAVVTNGWRVFVNGALVCNGHINWDGLPATGTVAPASAVQQVLGIGGAGAAPGVASSSAVPSMGGAGGASGTGIAGGTATPVAGTGSTPRSASEVLIPHRSLVNAFALLQGGGGGGSIATATDGGAASGAGGNVVVVAAYALSGSGSISANGGAGASTVTTGHFGAGGGGGGVVFLVTRTSAFTGTLSAAGGAGAVGSTTSGVTGAAGAVVQVSA